MAPTKRKVSIIIPTKDEGNSLVLTINKVKKYSDDIIVVDGHSKDQTKKIAKTLQVKYLLDNGLGKGDGVRLGLNLAKHEIIIIFDADGSPQAKDIYALVTVMQNQQADLVIASRRTGGSLDLNFNILGIARTIGCDVMVYLVNRHFKTKFSDILYSFRAIKKSIIKNLDLKSTGFEIEQEMVVKCLKKGYTVVEIPSRENARISGNSKLKTILGIKMLLSLLRELYS